MAIVVNYAYKYQFSKQNKQVYKNLRYYKCVILHMEYQNYLSVILKGMPQMFVCDNMKWHNYLGVLHGTTELLVLDTLWNDTIV